MVCSVLTEKNAAGVTFVPTARDAFILARANVGLRPRECIQTFSHKGTALTEGLGHDITLFIFSDVKDLYK